MTKPKVIKLLKQQSRVEKVGKTQNEDGYKDRLSSWSEPYVPDSSYTANDAFRGLGRYLELCRPKPKPPKVNHISYCEICKKTIKQQIGIHYAESHNVEKVGTGQFICHNCQKNLSSEEVIKHHCQSQMISAKAEQKRQDTSFAEIVERNPLVRKCPICGYRYKIDRGHFSIYHPKEYSIENICLICHQRVKFNAMTDHLHNLHSVEFVEKSTNASEMDPNTHLMRCTACGKRLHPAEVTRHLSEVHGIKRNKLADHKSQVPLDVVSADKLAIGNEVRRKVSNARQSERENLIDNVLSQLERRQMDDDLDFDDEDGGKYLGWQERESGKFGSLPLYDDYSDEPIES